MKRKIRKDLTDEKLAEIAAKYGDLTEFQHKESPTYGAICRRGLVDKLCGHMKRNRKVHWTDEELADVASHYDVLADFIEKEPSVYNIINSRGLNDKLCGHMKREREEHGTKEDLAAVAAKYDDLMEFKEKEPRVYSVIHNRGYYFELTAHMKRGKKAKWSDDELAEIASRYNSIQEFYTKDFGAFSAICKRGLIDKLCGHMERKGNLYKRKIYAFTFSDGYAYIGLSQNPKHRYWEHVKGKGYSPVRLHIEETGESFKFTILTDWLEKDVAAKVEDDYIQEYLADGWKMLNKARGGALGSLTAFYTERRIMEEARKYDYVEDFRKYSPGFYRYVRNHQLFDKYCSHMKSSYVSKKKMADEERMAIIASCKTSGELYKKSPTVYKWLHKHHRLYEFYPKKKLYLTDEERMEIITSCKTRRELQKKSPREYKWLLRHKRLDEYFPK